MGRADEPVRALAHRYDAFRVPSRDNPRAQDHHVVGALLYSAVLFHHLDPDNRVLLIVFCNLCDLRLHELDAHRLRVLIELLEPLPERTDVHVVDRDVHEGQRSGEQHCLLDRVHAADAGAPRHAEAPIPGAGALDVGDAVGHLSVGGSEHPAEGSVRCQEAFHLESAEHVGQTSLAVLSRRLHRGQRVAGGQDDCPGIDLDLHRLLQVIHGVGGANLGALPADDAGVDVQHGNLGDRVRKGDVDRFPGTEATLELVLFVDIAGILAEAAADAGVLVHVPRLLRDAGPKAPVDPFRLGHFRVCQ